MLSAQPAPAICSSARQNGQMTIYRPAATRMATLLCVVAKKPNYHADDIAAACDTLHEFDLPEHLVVDFSHGNCQKQHRRQLEVCEDICQQTAMALTAIAELWRKVSCAKERKNRRRSAAHLRSIHYRPVSGLGRYRTPGRKLASAVDTASECVPIPDGMGILRNLLSSTNYCFALARHNIDNKNHCYINSLLILCVIRIAENSPETDANHKTASPQPIWRITSQTLLGPMAN